jgi:hypothetical protein
MSTLIWSLTGKRRSRHVRLPLALALFGTASMAGAAILDQDKGLHAYSHEVPISVLEIPTDTLSDVAVARYDVQHPVIYYSPKLMRRLGPQLSDFFMAHEYAHIHYRHTQASALSNGRMSRDSLLQLRELEADCYATETLGSTNVPAIAAALRFFSRLGATRFDAEHPTGAQRAAMILACLPPAESAPTAP